MAEGGTVDVTQDSQERRRVGGYKDVKDKSLWVVVKPENKWLKWCELRLNPVVTFSAIIIIIAFISWAINNPDVASSEFGEWQAWIGRKFTWFYIGSQDVWAIFIIVIVFSKYSSLKLGKDDSEPEYNDATWFSMLFACGVSTGLFFYGVAEPVLHYTGKNRYSADPFTPDNTLAQEAMNVTLYHWGLHGWVVYTIVGLLMGVMSHREGLPMTLKSCFYPLIGEKIFGWIGDLIDVLSVIATLFGVCTSLGLGTIQINEGLNLLNENIEVSTRSQVIIIWSITTVATISVLTGIKHGIRRISEFCFCCGMVLMVAILLLDNTVFLLNLYTQSMGYYFNWLLQIGFHSDAFEQLPSSAGQEDRNRFLPEGMEDTAGPSTWMNGWTIFYWGWWIAWCPFVGMFIAKISYGRTVKEFIIGTMAAPSIYVFMWLVIFGGAGLRMERDAAENNLCCHNLNLSHILDMSKESPNLQLSLKDSMCNGEDSCNACSQKLIGLRSTEGLNLGELRMEINDVGLNNWGKTIPSRKYTRLSCRGTEQMWFDMMMSYGDLGNFLCGFSLMSLILYFVTSSDSGSLVIDCLASNGYPEPPALQRLFWAIMEGLAATALLVAGEKKTLTALQAVAIASGLIYTVLMCIACVALWKAFKIATGETNQDTPEFKIDILDPLLCDPLTEIFSSEFSSRTKRKLILFGKFLMNILTAPLSVAKSVKLIYGSTYMIPTLLFTGILLILFVFLHILNTVVEGAWALAWVCYVAFTFSISVVRTGARQKLKIPGSALEDFFVSVLLYPSVCLQMLETLEENVNVTPIKMKNLGEQNGGMSHSTVSLQGTPDMEKLGNLNLIIKENGADSPKVDFTKEE